MFAGIAENRHEEIGGAIGHKVLLHEIRRGGHEGSNLHNALDAAKVTESGNPNVMLCERGASFGYNTLVSDMRSLPIMASLGSPVIFDATHSVQQPGGQGTSSGGQREFVPVLARAAVSVGVDAVFLETHEDPDNAPSDGPNMVPLDKFEELAAQLIAFDDLAIKIGVKAPVALSA